MSYLYSKEDTQRPFPQGPSATPGRSEFFRDYGRVIHSPSFRRLQGKTQVFPLHESDFFRSRLTHSLEVSQIARGIASRLNATCADLQNNPLDSDLIATCSLVHDLGHPPFGHNGERALDDCMKSAGGFEGNAQTLRILSKIEKKVVEGGVSYGLNLTYRTLAGVIKYDNLIPEIRAHDEKLCKGYYIEESELVKKIKRNVLRGDGLPSKFKTIECQIMDIADDIAYSTYDLEDCFKAGLLDPVKIFSSPDTLFYKLSAKLTDIFKEEVSVKDIKSVLEGVFSGDAKNYPINDFDSFIDVNKMYKSLSNSAYARTKFSSTLVGNSINGIDMDFYDKNNPALSTIKIKRENKLIVEVLKNYTYLAMISSPIVKVPEYRGYEIVKSIFNSFSSAGGKHLLPEDILLEHEKASCLSAQKRLICDFVAGMTDRYAVEFYERLHSNTAQSMFKPI
ncbi:dGTP triphosphohydrolase [Gluconobacter aidae]|uniref:Deoxyguanosinetriphosphate triphosphohydrolase-like protein n=1 Tax=Gluconobacter aidae TaxID=2662454 RepID=A0A7X1SPH9_9PROT|nr:dNTP triphosphohydrolase [Gluconobacter aidae]MQR98791.1 dNTP triphosphohydrolase [Gluconobacter aidae]